MKYFTPALANAGKTSLSMNAWIWTPKLPDASLESTIHAFTPFFLAYDSSVSRTAARNSSSFTEYDVHESTIALTSGIQFASNLPGIDATLMRTSCFLYANFRLRVLSKQNARHWGIRASADRPNFPSIQEEELRANGTNRLPSARLSNIDHLLVTHPPGDFPWFFGGQKTKAIDILPACEYVLASKHAPMKHLPSTILLLTLCLSQSDAQWGQTTAPEALEASGSLFHSVENPGTWTPANSGLTNLAIQTFAVLPIGATHSGEFARGAISSFLFAGTYGGGVFRSTNNGTSWTEVNTGLTNQLINAFAIIDTVLFTGTYGGGVFRSSNYGANWSSVNSGLSIPYVLSLVPSPARTSADGEKPWNLFAGTYYGGVFLSTDNGANWIAVNSGLTHPFVGALGVSTEEPGGTKLFAGTLSGIFLSTNDGVSWTAANTGVTNGYVNTFAFCHDKTDPEGTLHTYIFAGTNGGGVFLSSDGGTGWIPSGLTKSLVRAFAVDTPGSDANGSGNPVVIAGVNGRGVFLTTDHGISWHGLNSGLANPYIHALALCPDGSGGTNLFVGTSGGIWRRSFGGMSSTAEPVAREIPEGFSLCQNYPNPFNAGTIIGYRVSGIGDRVVRLAVYDMLGREVAVLADGPMAPGSYKVEFNGENLASGVYLCRMTAGGQVATRKLILLR
jgi:hypothetical protein